MKKMITLFFALLISLTTANASCYAFVHKIEKEHGIPEGLLKAMLMLESRATPWAVNTNDASKFFSNKAQAVSYVKTLRQQGVGNINVGCGQLNVQSHGRNFKCINEMLDPELNIKYAARLLKRLKNQHGTWEVAVRRYNSPGEAGHHYQNKVFKIWNKNQMKDARSYLKDVKQEIASDTKKRKIQVGFGKRDKN